jgi:hypothetical protein
VLLGLGLGVRQAPIKRVGKSSLLSTVVATVARAKMGLVFFYMESRAAGSLGIKMKY